MPSAPSIKPRKTKAGSIRPGDVIVIRYEGPVGGPGMQEMLSVTAAIVGEGLGEDLDIVQAVFELAQETEDF